MKQAYWALITGSAHRLGRELSWCFAHAGWGVVLHANRSVDAAQALATELRGEGHLAHVVQGDLSALAAVPALFEAAWAASAGQLRCVVNSASQFEPDEALHFEPLAQRTQFDANLMAPMQLGALLAAKLKALGAPEDASVIHVLDQKVHNLNPDYFSYTVAKLALERSVPLMAQALAPHVRVCGVSPGLMYLSGPQTEENFKRASSANLLRRPIDPKHVAQAVLFLAGARGITGCTLPVDNGQHLVASDRDIMFVTDALLGAPDSRGQP